MPATDKRERETSSRDAKDTPKKRKAVTTTSSKEGSSPNKTAKIQVSKSTLYKV